MHWVSHVLFKVHKCFHNWSFCSFERRRYCEHKLYAVCGSKSCYIEKLFTWLMAFSPTCFLTHLLVHFCYACYLGKTRSRYTLWNVTFKLTYNLGLFLWLLGFWWTIGYLIYANNGPLLISSTSSTLNTYLSSFADLRIWLSILITFNEALHCRTCVFHLMSKTIWI